MKTNFSPVKTALFALLGLATAAPAAAMPLSAQLPVPQVQSNVDNVQYRSSNPARGFHRRGNYYYYNGHRGYRYQRPGWRYRNGWWFPPAAFALGVIVGSQYDRPARYQRRGDYSRAHYRWCENRYQTYRAWDNSYVPRVGFRAQCNSPYN